VDYAGTPRRGLYFVGPDASFPAKPLQAWTQGQDEDSKHWFPCYDSPNDKATSEVLVTVRRPFQALSNGRLVGVTEDRRTRTRTFHWREDFPHPAYLTSVVVGEFTEVRAESDGVPLLYWVPRADAGKVERTFGRTPAMLRFFSQAIDYPYPYEKYSQVVVHDFIFGGMENVTATTLTDAVLLDATAALDFHCDSLLAHELAHQWWGNLLTCKEWSHAWLNEGFATYFDALFAEHHRGTDEFRWQMQENAREYFREDEEKYRRPLVERRWSKPIEIFDRHLYEKGALVLHMLRNELGDELFWDAIRHYARKHQFQNVETTDLQTAIEEATGRSLGRFFDQWVYGAGFPTLEVSWSWNEPERQVRLRLRQRPDGDTPPFSFALAVEVVAGRDTVRHRVQVETAEQVVWLPAASRPLYVRVDPERWLLLKLEHERGRDELLAQLRHCRDWLGQAEAAEGLARFVGDGEVLDALAAALGRRRFFAAKRAAAAALARLGGDAARDRLIAALAEPDLRARRGIVRALREFRGDAAVATALRRAWKREKSYFVRAEILTTAARVGGAGAFEFVTAGLEVESFRDAIRAAALRALAELEDERGIDVALAWSRYGHGRWTRDAALKSLAALGRQHPRRAHEIQREIELLLRDPSFFAVLAAAEALGQLGRAQAVPALRRLQRADVDGRLQKAAREAIDALSGDGQSPDAWRALREEVRTLRDENREMRERLERVETRLGSPNGSAAGARRRAAGRRAS
jgi:aminopeptidase N